MSGKAVFKTFAGFLMVLLALAALATLQGPPKSSPKNERLEQPASAPGLAATATRPLHVSIILESGEFEIVPASMGTSIRVDADYDEALHRLEHEYVPDPVRGDRFTLRCESRSTWRHLRRAAGDLKSHVVENSGSEERVPRRARVRVELPVGVPMDLELDVGKGNTRIDLSGLSLERLILDHAMGDTELAFTQPNPIEMKNLIIHGKMGELTLAGLAHAHARALEFQGQMGDYKLDFTGEWGPKLEGSVQITMGSAIVDLPRDVHLEHRKGRVVFGKLDTSHRSSSRDPEVRQERTLELDTLVRFGNLEIR